MYTTWSGRVLRAEQSIRKQLAKKKRRREIEREKGKAISYGMCSNEQGNTPVSTVTIEQRSVSLFLWPPLAFFLLCQSFVCVCLLINCLFSLFPFLPLPLFIVCVCVCFHTLVGHTLAL